MRVIFAAACLAACSDGTSASDGASSNDAGADAGQLDAENLDASPLGICEDVLRASAACDGDLSGTWTAAAGCRLASFEERKAATQLLCATATIGPSTVEVSGSVTFDTNGASGSWTYSSETDLLQPDSCVARYGGCEGFARAAAMFGGFGGCTASPGLCRCTLPTPARTLLAEGAWSSDAGTIRGQNGDGGVDVYTCVSSGFLILRPSNTASTAIAFIRSGG